MGRTKGSMNKEAKKAPYTVDFTTEQKLEFIAALIVDKIIEDKNNGHTILKRMRKGNAAS